VLKILFLPVESCIIAKMLDKILRARWITVWQILRVQLACVEIAVKRTKSQRSKFPAKVVQILQILIRCFWSKLSVIARYPRMWKLSYVYLWLCVHSWFKRRNAKYLDQHRYRWNFYEFSRIPTLGEVQFCISSLTFLPGGRFAEFFYFNSHTHLIAKSIDLRRSKLHSISSLSHMWVCTKVNSEKHTQPGNVGNEMQKRTSPNVDACWKVCFL